MSYHFSQYLTENKIKSISNRLGFGIPDYLEKFLMDFEMYFHISKKIDCLVRGGMCMPFHTNEELRRLSVDIDIITKKTVSETSDVMKDLDGLLGLSIKQKTPKTAYPIKNLLSYDVIYESCLGPKDKIKVDFLCEVGLDLPKTSSVSGFKMFECELDFPIQILKHGALIGDKLTTLSINTIGLPKRRYEDIPKQIFDISTLIKLADLETLKESFTVFKDFTEFKVKIYESSPLYTVTNVTEDIDISLKSFLNFDPAFSLTPVEDGRYRNFKGRYLGGKTREQYRKTMHITDALIVWLFIRKLSNYLFQIIDLDEACESLHKSINLLSQMEDYDAVRRGDEQKDILEEIDNLDFNKNVLNGSPLEHVYLLKEIFS